MAKLLRGEVEALAPYGKDLSTLDVYITPEQDGVPSLYAETNSVYLTRPTEGTGELMELVGGSVAWGQIISATTPIVVATNNTAVKNFQVSLTYVAGHKYLCLYTQETTLTSNTRNTLQYYDGTNYVQQSAAPNRNLSAGQYWWIYSPANSTNNGNIGIWCHTPNVEATYDKYMLFDLTQMFGSTIADYVYSLEQATAGSGIQWLKDYDLIDDNYHAYSAPTLQSVEATSHVTVGKNMFGYTLSDFADGTSYGLSTYLELSVPEGRYTISTDAPTGYIWGGTELGNNYVRVYSGTPNVVNVTTGKKILIGIVSSDKEAALAYHTQIERGSTVTAYEPYTETTYPLANITLRGMLKKDASNNLYYDGDTYEWDGTVTRKYKEVTFDGSSDENWNVAVSGGHYRGYINISDIKPFDGSFSSISMLYKCSPFVNGTWDNVFGGNAVAGMTGQNWGFGLDALSITDSAGLKTWLSSHPIELIYELATPTTESADPFTAVQTVEDGGTEEFVTTNGVPVGVVGRFANVAPISGHSVIAFYTGNTIGIAEGSYAAHPGREIYGGVFDALNGKITETMDEIAEYNGETIGEPWLSSLDVYSQGTTPTSGAQVFYTKTPTTFTVAAPEITIAKAYWWADCGEVVWEYGMLPLGLRAVVELVDPYEGE